MSNVPIHLNVGDAVHWISLCGYAEREAEAKFTCDKGTATCQWCKALILIAEAKLQEEIERLAQLARAEREAAALVARRWDDEKRALKDEQADLRKQYEEDGARAEAMAVRIATLVTEIASLKSQMSQFGEVVNEAWAFVTAPWGSGPHPAPKLRDAVARLAAQPPTGEDTAGLPPGYQKAEDAAEIEYQRRMAQSFMQSAELAKEAIRRLLCHLPTRFPEAAQEQDIEFARAIVGAVTDVDCPVADQCHGTMKWCNTCGDVTNVCNARPCDAHPRTP